MTIVVNARFLLDDYLEGYGHFLKETLQRIVKSRPEHRFIFVFDRKYDPHFLFGENVQAVVIGPPARHPLLWKWWYDQQVPSLLKKFRADVFLSGDGFCSLRTNIPQCLVIHDLAFLHFPEFIKRSHLRYYKKNTGKFLQKAKRIVTVSEFSKKDLIDNYTIDPGKIDVIYNAARDSFHTISDQEKKQVKEKYTTGREFFLYAGSIHPRKNLVSLLKAFSMFKKRMGSNFKLVLAGRTAWKSGPFLQSLNSYKYRSDLVLTGYLEENEFSNMMGAAYALVYPSLFEGFGMPVLEAMRAAVPVITSEGTAMEEVAKGAALLADPSDHNDIAEKMMILYKDESLRNQLIEKGKQVYPMYSWDRSADLLWNAVLKAIGQV